jgi:methanogenic corrinoid protein MtbC1
VPPRADNAPAAVSCCSPAEIERLTRAAIDGPDAEAVSLAMAIQGNATCIGQLMTSLLQPAARLLGEWWEQDRCSFADVTIGMGRLRVVMGQLSAHGAPAETAGGLRGRCLASLVPGERHSFGLAMLVDMLERDGWSVERVYAPTVAGLVGAVRAEPFDLVCLSAGSEQAVARLPGLIQAIRRASARPGLRIMAGGPAFARGVASATVAGADAGAVDAHDAIRTARAFADNGENIAPAAGEVRISTYNGDLATQR